MKIQERGWSHFEEWTFRYNFLSCLIYFRSIVFKISNFEHELYLKLEMFKPKLNLNLENS